MKLKSPTNETVIANALVAILERLDMLEKATSLLAGQHLAMLKAVPVSAAPNVEQAILLQKLEKLTLKRHAVLTATLGGQSYQAIANAMGCDLTTVKLHLKAALEVLGIRNRSFLLVSWPNVLDFISDMEYEARYGVSKRWWLENKPELMAVLRACKPTNNQHTK
jgi:DNA-binding NarL/FixJ family response regulator